MVRRLFLIALTLVLVFELKRAFCLQLSIVKALEAASKAKPPGVRRIGESKSQSRIRVAEQIIKAKIDSTYPRSAYRCFNSVPCFEWQVDKDTVSIAGEIRWFLIFRLSMERSLSVR